MPGAPSQVLTQDERGTGDGVEDLSEHRIGTTEHPLIGNSKELVIDAKGKEMPRFVQKKCRC
jgi:hypothetical protein